jgi:hypothetical protein
VGTEAQAGLPVLLEKQRRHAGCARCVDGVDVHDARSGAACRAPTGRKLKAPAGGQRYERQKQKSRQDAGATAEKATSKGKEPIFKFQISNGSVDVHAEVQVSCASEGSFGRIHPAPASRGITKRWQATALQISVGRAREPEKQAISRASPLSISSFKIGGWLLPLRK